jgi:hypothetical protein
MSFIRNVISTLRPQAFVQVSKISYRFRQSGDDCPYLWCHCIGSDDPVRKWSRPGLDGATTYAIVHPKDPPYSNALRYWRFDCWTGDPTLSSWDKHVLGDQWNHFWPQFVAGPWSELPPVPIDSTPPQCTRGRDCYREEILMPLP